MKRFRFRLETVLKLRRRKEEAAQQELAVCQTLLLRELEAAVALEEARESARQQLAKDQAQALPAQHLHQYNLYMQKLSAEQARREMQAAVLEVEQEAKREALVSASRDKRVLEKLRDRRWATHLAECTAQERRITEDIATALSQPGGASGASAAALLRAPGVASGR